MKIIHICLENPYLDGWGYQENILPRYHSKMGHDVLVIASLDCLPDYYKSSKEYECDSEYSFEDITVVRLKSKFHLLRKRLVLYNGLYKKLEEKNPDVIVFHNIQSISLLEAARYSRNHPECRLLVDNHCDYYNSANSIGSKIILHKIIWRQVVKYALPSVEMFYSVTPWGADFAIEMYGIPKNKMDTLFLGADIDKIRFGEKDDIRNEIRKKLCIGNDDIVFITGGKIDASKRIYNLAKIIAGINNAKVHLLIFGIMDEDIKPLIDTLVETSINIHYIGWIESDDVYNYYLASDIAAFPGTQSVLWQQAICCGLPVILRKWPGGDYLNKGNVFYLFTDKDSELEQLLKLVIAAPQSMLKSMGIIALDYGLKAFSYEELAKQVLKE